LEKYLYSKKIRKRLFGQPVNECGPIFGQLATFTAVSAKRREGDVEQDVVVVFALSQECK
jgi:hypothetical protein